MKKPGQVVQPSPTPTTYNEPKWSLTPITWQDFKNKYGFQITIPNDWNVSCIEGTYTDCTFQSPQDIQNEEQGPEGEHGPYASLIIEVLDKKPMVPVLEKELQDAKIGTTVFNKYQVFGFGEVYGVAHGNKCFQFDALYDRDQEILSTFKFTK